jgi:hypothetical protein
MLTAAYLAPLFAEELSLEKQKFSQRCAEKRTAELRSRLNGIFQRISENTYLLREKGIGNYGEFQDIKWEAESKIQLRDNLLCPIYTITNVTDKQGVHKFSLRQDYDYQNQKIILLKTDAQQNVIDSAEFPLKNNTVDFITLVFSLKPLAQKQGPKETIRFNLLSIEPQLYKIIARFEKEEKIKIGGRELEALKMRLTVDKSMLNLVLPSSFQTLFIWYEKTPPHAWLKYEGLESGKNSPYVIIEARQN